MSRKKDKNLSENTKSQAKDHKDKEEDISNQTYLRNQNDDYTYKDGYQETKKTAVKPIQKKS